MEAEPVSCMFAVEVSVPMGLSVLESHIRPSGRPGFGDHEFSRSKSIVLRLKGYWALTLGFVSLAAAAGNLELPLRANFKDTPLNQNPVLSYAILGTFPDGTPAVTRNGDSARFFIRDKLTDPATGKNFTLEELNCRTGQFSGIGMGTPERIVAFLAPLDGSNVTKHHPDNRGAYRQICAAAGLKSDF